MQYVEENIYRMNLFLNGKDIYQVLEMTNFMNVVGADLKSKNQHGVTLLHYLMTNIDNSNFNGRYELASFLFNNYVDVSARLKNSGEC